MKYLFYGLVVWVCVYGQGCSSSEPAEEATEQKSIREVDRLAILIDKNPRDYTLYEERSRAWYQEGEVDSALQAVNQALALFRNGSELHYLKGFYLWNLQDTLQALASLDAAIGLGSENPEAYYQKGQILFFQEKYDEVVRWYEEALARDSLEPTYLMAKGLLLEAQGRVDEAVSWHKQAVELDTSFIKSLARLHDLYLGHYGNELVAKTFTDRILRVDPGHPLGRFQLGDYYFRQAIQKDPLRNQEAYQQALNEAIVQYTIAIRRDTLFADAYYNRGYSYLLADHAGIALEDFTQVRKLSPNHPQALFMTASIYESYGDLSTALTFYQQVLKVDSSFPEAKEAVNEILNTLSGG